MPVPQPHGDESQDEFVSRCMGTPSMVDEYDQEQRAAICYQTWRDRNKGTSDGTELKAFNQLEVKDEAKGEVEAVIATLDCVDKDMDVIRAGAIPDGAKVKMSSYGHDIVGGMFTPGTGLPVGKGTITVTNGRAIFKGKIFTSTTRGRDTLAVLKEMGSDQEWSFGFRVMGAEVPDDDWRSKGAERILTKLDVYEVSPVLVGAGVDTRTLMAKRFDRKYSPDQPRDDQGQWDGGGGGGGGTATVTEHVGGGTAADVPDSAMRVSKPQNYQGYTEITVSENYLPKMGEDLTPKYIVSAHQDRDENGERVMPKARDPVWSVHREEYGGMGKERTQLTAGLTRSAGIMHARDRLAEDIARVGRANKAADDVETKQPVGNPGVPPATSLDSAESALRLAEARLERFVNLGDPFTVDDGRRQLENVRLALRDVENAHAQLRGEGQPTIPPPTPENGAPEYHAAEVDAVKDAADRAMADYERVQRTLRRMGVW